MDAAQQHLYDMFKRHALENEETARRIERYGIEKDRVIVHLNLAAELHAEAAKLKGVESVVLQPGESHTFHFSIPATPPEED
jgi:hypothetical protein